MLRQVKNNVSWVGYVDWGLDKFHGDDLELRSGSSQNSYLIREEKTVLIDTVYSPHAHDFVDNLKQSIDLRKIDYIVINHGERDHSGALRSLMKEIPDTPIFCTKNCVNSLKGQYGDLGWNFHPVQTGNYLDIGNNKRLIFIEMKMIHWPDSMATYLTGDNILFSNDAFGQHYATSELFNDNADQCTLDRKAMDYYANILMQYSMILRDKLGEIEKYQLPIDMIAPSHGVIWRDNPQQIMKKYADWCNNYKEDQVTIIYSTVWNSTAKMAQKIADEVKHQDPKTKVKIYNVHTNSKNTIMTEVFKSKAIAVGSPTISGGIMSSLAGWLEFLKQLKFHDKRAAAFGSYGWSGESAAIIQQTLVDCGFNVSDELLRANWNPNKETDQEIGNFVHALLDNNSRTNDGEDHEQGANRHSQAPAEKLKRYQCEICDYTYDPKLGDSSSGIAPGTKFEDLSDDWVCPVCGSTKAAFEEFK